MNQQERVIQEDLQKTGFGYTLAKIGGKYKITVLYLLALNETPIRYNQLKRLIGTISFKTLTNTLRELEHDQLIERKEYPQIPPKVEYRLTALGVSLLPVLDAICQWGETQLSSQKTSE